MNQRYLYSLDEVAAMTGLSARWLADQCRANKIEHEDIEHTRRMTLAQIDTLIAQHRKGPASPADAETRERYLNRLASKQSRTPRKIAS